MPPDSNNKPEVPEEDLLSEESYGLWKIHPVTIALVKELRETRAQLKEALSSGITLTGSAGDTAEKTARIVGTIEGINLLLDIKYEDEEGATNDIMPD